jgi:preprotein translocase subunit SecF
MAFGDKPSVIARDAAEAAAIAKQASDTANQAASGLAAAPDGSFKDTALKVLGGIGVVGGIVSTALTAGTGPAIVAGVTGIAIYIAGLFHTTPKS